MTDSNDLHEFTLRWPYSDAYNVIATGTFDQWSSSLHLSRTANGFEAPVRIPWQDKITYKFIVDGHWTTSDREPTETDYSGFVNNVYTAPPRPEPPAIEEPPTVDVTETEPESQAAAATSTGVEGNGSANVSSIAGQLHETIIAPAVAFANSMDAPYEATTPPAETEPRSLMQEVKDAVAPVASSARERVAPTVEKAQESAAPVLENVAQVAPSASEVKSKETEADAAQPEPVPTTETEAEIAAIVPIAIVPLSTEDAHSSVPEAEIVPGTSVSTAAPVTAAGLASTHTAAPEANTEPTKEATEAARVVVAVPTIAAEPPVVEVPAKPADEPAPQVAPPILAAQREGEPKDVEVTPVSGNAVATAAAPVPFEAVETVEEEKKVDAPEVLAAPPVVGDGKEIVAVTETTGSGSAPEPLPLPETTPAGPMPALVTEPEEIPETNGKTNGHAKGSSVFSTPEKKKSNGRSTPTPSSGRNSPDGTGTTKSKKWRQSFAFPREPSESGSIEGSPTRFPSLRKKRNSSIFGKLKGIFGGDKEKDKKEGSPESSPLKKGST